jgi:CelD/BcsL family acetyltransferase involved in cellulose biosynthesis
VARIYRSLDELETIRAGWNDLLVSYPPSTTFSTPEWLVSWWRSFGKNQELLAAGFFEGGVRLVGLALLSVTRVRVARIISLRMLRFMGDGSKDSDNLDFLVRPGSEDAFAKSFLAFLKQTRKVWDFCELNTMPPESPGANALRRLLREKRWIMVEEQRPASAIRLPQSWEEYLGQLSSEDQKNLTRYARRIEKRYAVSIYRCCDEGQLTKCLEALFVHHQARWEMAGERGSFGSAERRSFYHDLSRALLVQDRLELWVLELDGRIVAAQFAFRYGDKVFQLQEGNDPKHASDRVGFLLRGQVLKELIAQGVRTYDFLGGETGYKARWGAQPRHYLDVRFARPFSPGAAYIAGAKEAAIGKQWLRRSLPPSLWHILHRANVKLRKGG